VSIRAITLSVATAAVAWAAGSARGDDSAHAARAAVRKALTFLAADMQQWRGERVCAACHHGPMYVWAGGVAQKQGYAADSADIAETARWMVTDDQARVFPKAVAEGGSRPRLSLAAVYLGHALNALSGNDELRAEGWRRVAGHLAAAQREDGGWSGPEGRPPIFNTPLMVTRTARLALLDAARERRNLVRRAGPQTIRSIERSAEKADIWLAAAPSDHSHLALVLASAAREAPGAALVDDLLKRQNPDGGWAQTAELASDAFATGQSLWAVRRAGLSVDDAAVRRAIAFLAESQKPDGAWPMISRPDPANGSRAKNLNPITYAATAWATIGLASHVAEAADASENGAVRRRPSGGIANRRASDRPAGADCPVGQCPGDTKSGKGRGDAARSGQDRG
jgi:hypothetical protein